MTVAALTIPFFYWNAILMTKIHSFLLFAVQCSTGIFLSIDCPSDLDYLGLGNELGRATNLFFYAVICIVGSLYLI